MYELGIPSHKVFICEANFNLDDFHFLTANTFGEIYMFNISFM